MRYEISCDAAKSMEIACARSLRFCYEMLKFYVPLSTWDTKGRIGTDGQDVRSDEMWLCHFDHPQNQHKSSVKCRIRDIAKSRWPGNISLQHFKNIKKKCNLLSWIKKYQFGSFFRAADFPTCIYNSHFRQLTIYFCLIAFSGILFLLYEI